MNTNVKPFARIVQILKEASASRADAPPKWNQAATVHRYLIEVIESMPDSDVLNGLNFAPVDPDDERAYERINRLMKRDLLSLSKRPKPMNDFREVCGLLKIGLTRNIGARFNDEGKRNAAVQKFDAELKRISDQVKQVKALKNKPEQAGRTAGRQQQATIQAMEGNAVMNVQRIIHEIYAVFELLESAGVTIPEFVEDYIWDKEYESYIVVRNKEHFVFSGDDRQVAFAVLETPLTDDVRLVRLGSDYWSNVEASMEWDASAFYVDTCGSLAEAAARIIDTLNEESDLDAGLSAEHDSPVYETHDSLNEKISRLLAG